MRDDAHARAQRLIDRDAVEGIAPDEREWLDRHLESCHECSGASRTTERALRNLRSISIPVPADLAGRTQFRVYLRAREMRPRERAWALWATFALSWVLGIASAPLVWRGFEWVGRVAGLPTFWLKLGFGLWWAIPAAVAVGGWLLDKKRIEER